MLKSLSAIFSSKQRKTPASDQPDPALTLLQAGQQSLKRGDLIGAIHQFLLSAQFYLQSGEFSAAFQSLEYAYDTELARQTKLTKKRSAKQQNHEPASNASPPTSNTGSLRTLPAASQSHSHSKSPTHSNTSNSSNSVVSRCYSSEFIGFSEFSVDKSAGRKSSKSTDGSGSGSVTSSASASASSRLSIASLNRSNSSDRRRASAILASFTAAFLCEFDPIASSAAFPFDHRKSLAQPFPHRPIRNSASIPIDFSIYLDLSSINLLTAINALLESNSFNEGIIAIKGFLNCISFTAFLPVIEYSNSHQQQNSSDNHHNSNSPAFSPVSPLFQSNYNSSTLTVNSPLNSLSSIFPYLLLRSQSFSLFGYSSIRLLFEYKKFNYFDTVSYHLLWRARQAIEISCELDIKGNSMGILKETIKDNTSIDNEFVLDLILDYAHLPPIQERFFICFLLDLILSSHAQQFELRPALNPSAVAHYIDSYPDQLMDSPQIKFARQLFGLVHLSQAIPQRFSDAASFKGRGFSGSAGSRENYSRILSSLWIEELLREFSQLCSRAIHLKEETGTNIRFTEEFIALTLIDAVRQIIQTANDG